MFIQHQKSKTNVVESVETLKDHHHHADHAQINLRTLVMWMCLSRRRMAANAIAADGERFPAGTLQCVEAKNQDERDDVQRQANERKRKRGVEKSVRLVKLQLLFCVYKFQKVEFLEVFLA